MKMQMRHAHSRVGARAYRPSNCFEILENRTLLNAISPGNFGAVPNDGNDDRGGIQAAINAAGPGDVVQFSPGQYDINGELVVGNNKTLHGADNHASKLVFNTGFSRYAIYVNGSDNITIDGLGLKANCGVIWGTTNANHVRVTNNDFEWGYNGQGGERNAVRFLGSTNDLKIEYNTFHDSLSSDRAVILFNTTDTSYSYNTFHRINDGGHLDGSHHNLRVVGNRGDKIHRMGIEIQDHDARGGNAGDGILVSDNVFWDWYQPYYWSFGMSVSPAYSRNVVIQNNYLSVFAPGQTQPSEGGWGDGGRAGFAIEACFASGMVQNNVAVGPWFAHIAVSEPNSPLKDNKTYGQMGWQPYAAEQGQNGVGSIDDRGGNVALPFDQAPPLPAPLWDQSNNNNNNNTSGGNTGGNTGGGNTGGGNTGGGTTTGGNTSGGTTSQSSDPTQPDNTQQSQGGGVRYLSDMPATAAINGLGPVERNASNGSKLRGDGSRMLLDGKIHKQGLGVAGNSEITFNLAGKYTGFFSNFGIDDRAGKHGSMTFEVWADGTKIYDSGTMTALTPSKWRKLNVTGVQTLKLVTTDAGDGPRGDIGNWARPMVW